MHDKYLINGQLELSLHQNCLILKSVLAALKQSCLPCQVKNQTIVIRLHSFEVFDQLKFDQPNSLYG